jgi:hypothetical protein
VSLAPGTPPARKRSRCSCCARWRTGYDRRRHEARLTSHPQFTTTIDGQNIHFPHAAREAPDVLVSDIGDFSRKVC